MGERGAPLGNQNAKKGRVWSQAIERALAKRSKADQIEAIDVLAEKLLTLCEQGDLQALKELGDRMEGKSPQGVTISGDEDNPLRISSVVRKIVDPTNTGQP